MNPKPKPKPMPYPSPNLNPSLALTLIPILTLILTLILPTIALALTVTLTLTLMQGYIGCRHRPDRHPFYARQSFENLLGLGPVFELGLGLKFWVMASSSSGQGLRNLALIHAPIDPYPHT
jgi:hypothetical protein